MFAFLSLLFVLLVIYAFTTRDSSPLKEGFETPPNHMVKIPATIAPLPPAQAAPEPANLPGPLPIAPYQQIAAMSPLPYQDTALIKANRQQLVSLLEMLKGFLAFEAQEISERSDPTIQLPLATARTDFNTLQNEVEVLNRNPGIQPNMTLSHLNEISSNLAFLQEKVRLIGAAGSIQGPVYEFTVEAFANKKPAPRKGKAVVDNPNASNHGDKFPKKRHRDKQQPASSGQPATLKDLQEFMGRIQGEIIRLSNSGTTDPNVQSRIGKLTSMQGDVRTIATELQKGLMAPSDVPIMKSDLDRAFPILGNMNEPLPQIIQQLRLPPGLANALPSNVQKDPETMHEISKLVDKYADTIVNGVSASFSVKYTSPREAEAGQGLRSMKGRMHGLSPYEDDEMPLRKSTIDRTGFPSASDLDNATNAKFTPLGSDPITDRLAERPCDAGRGPSHFDWKERAKQIEGQVHKRGLKHTDYGIMPKGTKTSEDFSWRGYCKMICTRLQASMDPSLPETCGCPPMDWKGWRK